MKMTKHDVDRWRHRSICQRYTETPALIAFPSGKKKDYSLKQVWCIIGLHSSWYKKDLPFLMDLWMTISTNCLFSDISNQLAMFSPERKVILSCSIRQGFHLKEFLHLICHNKALMFSLKKLEKEQEKKSDQVTLKSS